MDSSAAIDYTATCTLVGAKVDRSSGEVTGISFETAAFCVSTPESVVFAVVSGAMAAVVTSGIAVFVEPGLFLSTLAMEA